MIVKKLMTIVIALGLSGAVNTGAVLAAEIQKTPLQINEIAALEQLGGNQIQSLVSGKVLDKSNFNDALTTLSDEHRQAILSVTPEQLDKIIAGEMDAGTVLVAALAAVGIFFIILVIAAS